MIDELTGLPDIFGLLDRVNRQANQESSTPTSVFTIQLIALWQVNREQGYAAGDELLKRCTQMLKAAQPDPAGQTVFRSGDDKFAVLLEGKDPAAARAQAQRLSGMVNSAEIDAPLPAARAAVIHFSTQAEFTPGNVLACLFVALADRYHQEASGQMLEFEASVIRNMVDYPWMVRDLAQQMIRQERKTGELRKIAEMDMISQLPNQWVAIHAIEDATHKSLRDGSTLSVLLIDGDNLRQYNEMSYNAGDQVIRQISMTIRSQLRDSDFLARYRSGDEFLVLLPETPLDHALHIARRLCWAVERASKDWLMPTTISIGAAVCPAHGKTVQELLEFAERGLDLAKHNGKNQAAVYHLPSPYLAKGTESGSETKAGLDTFSNSC